jgi:hypothetical protein
MMIDDMITITMFIAIIIIIITIIIKLLLLLLLLTFDDPRIDDPMQRVFPALPGVEVMR